MVCSAQSLVAEVAGLCTRRREFSLALGESSQLHCRSRDINRHYRRTLLVSAVSISCPFSHHSRRRHRPLSLS